MTGVQTCALPIYDMNVTGVPAMLIQGKYMIPGAQEPEVYVNALRRVVEREL